MLLFYARRQYPAETLVECNRIRAVSNPRCSCSICRNRLALQLTSECPPLLDVVRSFLPVTDWELYIAVVEWQDGFAWSRLLNHRGLRIFGNSNGNYDIQPLPLAEQAVVKR